MSNNMAHAIFKATDRIPLPPDIRPVFGAAEVHPAIYALMRQNGWMTPDVLEFVAGYARHIRATTPQHNLMGYMGCKFHGEDDRMDCPVNRLMKDFRWGGYKFRPVAPDFRSWGYDSHLPEEERGLPVKRCLEFLRSDWVDFIIPGRSFLEDKIKGNENLFRWDIAEGLDRHVKEVFDRFGLDWEKAEELMRETIWEYAEWSDAHNSHCEAHIVPIEGVGGRWEWEGGLKLDAAFAFGDGLCWGTRG